MLCARLVMQLTIRLINMLLKMFDKEKRRAVTVVAAQPHKIVKVVGSRRKSCGSVDGSDLVKYRFGWFKLIRELDSA